ncbi:MAG TPA: hypothetical protein VJH88_01945 [Candidatus Nanoarchaeia archaeon]|nr:hypothetical protein [Candidatus Nanoarchaeia archaeon]
MSAQMWQDKVFAAVLLLFLLAQGMSVDEARVFGWDESVYIGMGKYIASNGTQGLWEDIRPIGLPLLLSIIPAGFSDWLMLSFAAASMVLVYLIVRKISPLMALVAVLLYGVTPLFFSQAHLVMTHVPAVTFVLLAYYLFAEHPVFVGLSLGAAFLFRFPHGIAVAVFFFVYFFGKKYKECVLVIIGFLALLVPFFAFNVVLYHTITATLFDAAFRPVIFAFAHQSNPFHAGSPFFYVSELLWQNPLFIFACFGLFFRRMRTISLLFFAYLLYFSVIPNKQSRFILDFLPFAVILSSYGLWRVVGRLKKHWTHVAAFVFLCIVIQAPVIMQISYESWTDVRLVSFFTSFSSLDGTTITTTPLPAAYSNHLFLPIYDNPDVALQLYPAFLSSAMYVLYTDDFYPCADVSCAMKKEMLYEQITDNILISNVSVGETSYLLFQVIYTKST